MSSYNTSSGQIYHNPKYSAMDIMQRAKARLIESSVGMAGMLLPVSYTHLTLPTKLAV